MTQSLKKRFIVTAMTAITVLLAVLLGLINIVNAAYNKSESRNMLNAIYNSTVLNLNAAFPDFGNSGGNRPDMGPDMKPKNGFFNPDVTEHNKMSAVFFIVRCSSGNSKISVLTARSTVSPEEAVEIAEQTVKKGKDSGYIGSYKYTTAQLTDGGRAIIFLDITSAKTAVMRVLVISVFMTLLCWGLMLLLVIKLSNKAILPFAENIERQKQFVTDAGHEIKTPLAIILANTEALELHNGQNKWSRNIREQVNRLSGLTQNLLTLARVDENSVLTAAEDISLSELISDTFDMFTEPAALKGVMIDTAIESGLKMTGNTDMITRLVSILADNAVKYSVSGSVIEVNLKKTEKNIEFKIKNTCENLPEVPPEKLFDRFYRADSARTQKKGGYGIGLSAAEAIVRLHKGNIFASYGENNSITFTVRI